MPPMPIRTDRLVLRAIEASDAADIAHLIADWPVIRWLTMPPWPYGLADAELFAGSDRSATSRAIICDDTLVGVVGLSPDMGYWLGQKYWGKGYMSEATLGLLGAHFAGGGRAVKSGYMLGNDASGRVLEKLGFTNTNIRQDHSRPLERKVNVQKMLLTPDAWAAHHG